MEGYVLIILLIIGTPLIAGIWLISRAINAKESIEELSRRLRSLESEISRLKSDQQPNPLAEPVASGQLFKEAASPKPWPATGIVHPKQALESARSSPVATPIPVIPPVIRAQPPPLGPTSEKAAPTINWEQFMGVKLFAWIGGLALFLGVSFFVKYSFDNNLVPPGLRVALGLAAGLGLLIGGVVLSRRDYPALSQTICATGILILYAATLASHSIYRFRFFALVPTFLLMALFTATAFFLAARLEALVVAILGMLGGFLTPFLLSTGQDNPAGLFGYIAILDLGLILLALKRHWFFLATLAAAGTVFTQIGWLSEFFTSEKYFAGNRIFIPMSVLIGFNGLYLLSGCWAKRRAELELWLAGGALGVGGGSIAITGWFLTFAPLAQRPWLMFSFAFLIDVVVIVLALLEKRIAPAQPIFGLVIFGLLAMWTMKFLTTESLAAALTFYFTFAVLHAVIPVTLLRRRGMTLAFWTTQVFPPLALALMLIPVLRLPAISLIVWPFVLLVDVLAIGLAVVTASLFTVIAVLVLTLAATGALILKIPATLTGLPTSFFLLGGFAVFFMTTGIWLTTKFNPQALQGQAKVSNDLALPANLAVQLPGLSSMLPFLLLMLATLRLPIADPWPLFGLALLLVLLLLAVTRLFFLDWMPAIGLACVAALEWEWHFNHFDPAHPARAFLWYLVFLIVFAVFPFVFFRKFTDRVVPWGTAAMAGPAQFLLIYRIIKTAYPNDFMGLLPALFAVPPLLSLFLVMKKK